MAKKFSKVQDKAPRPGRDNKEDLFSASPVSQFSKKEESKKSSTEPPEKTSMLIKDMDYALMEKLKNIVFTEKMSGDYFATQSSIAIRAIEQFIESYDKEIKERPERVKKTEEKLRNRKR
ncbi:MAG: hypothetical protein AAF600_06825 [Bacteroidota bacterium]